MTRVLIVDDHSLVRRLIRNVLVQLDDFEVVGEAANGAEAIALATAEQPDVILMDISLPGMSGLDTMKQIRQQGVSSRFIVLSMHVSPELVKDALDKGADGYLMKGGELEELLRALHVVAEGKQYFDATTSRWLG